MQQKTYCNLLLDVCPSSGHIPQASITIDVVLPPVVTRTKSTSVASLGNITLQATAQTPGSVLYYTLDGSRPTLNSLAWPGGSGGVLSLAPRTTAVFVKAFPPSTGAWLPGKSRAGNDNLHPLSVESPVAGGIFTPI
jgi:hypothetical protein